MEVLLKEPVINLIRSYRTYLMMFRLTGTDFYLFKAIQSHYQVNKLLGPYGIRVPRLHRSQRSI